MSFKCNEIKAVLVSLSLVVCFSTQLLGTNSTDKTVLSTDCPKTESFCVGTLKYEDGSIYEGEFRFGEPHGKGTIKWLDGTYYTGAFLGGFRHGFGVQTLENGSKYEGNWRMDVMQGEGTFTWANGAVYTGLFYGDTMNGKGKLELANGDSWVGEFNSGKPSGKGTFEGSDGRKCKEPRKDGKRHGLAVTDWNSGNRCFVEWKMGTPIDKMGINFANGDQCVLYLENGLLQKDVVYITKDAEETELTLSQIEKHFKNEKTELENVQFLFYTIAIQHKSMKDYKAALNFLKDAESIAVQSKKLNKNIVEELAYVKEKL